MTSDKNYTCSSQSDSRYPPPLVKQWTNGWSSDSFKHSHCCLWMKVDRSIWKKKKERKKERKKEKKTVAPYYMKTFQEHLYNTIRSHSHDPGLNYHHLLNPRYRSIAEFCFPGKWDLPLWADLLSSEMRHVNLIMLKCSLFTLELKFIEGLRWFINCTLFL